MASPATIDYTAALAAYDRGYYTRALAGFRRVLAAYPQHPYAARYARLARHQIAAGHDRTPPARSHGLAIALAGSALGAAVVAMIVLAWSRRRRLASLPGGEPGPGPSPATGTQNGPAAADTPR